MADPTQHTAPQMIDLIDAISSDGLSPGRRKLIQMLMMQNSLADAEPGMQSEEVVERGAAPEAVSRQDAALLAAAEERISDLEDLLGSIAEALGACPRCFGANDRCQACSGDGGPGSSAPDREAFEFFVLPVLNRLRRRRGGAKPAAAAVPARPHANPERSA